MEIFSHLGLDLAQGGITLAVELFSLVFGHLRVSSVGLGLANTHSEVLGGAVGVQAAVFAHLQDKAAGPLSVNVLRLSVAVFVQFYV